jgi:hypothetical protein
MKEKKKKSMLQLGNEMTEEHQPPTPYSPLTHDENLRANALSLACRYYVETICKDGDLYREMVRDNKVLKPATYVGVIQVAFSFEMFIRGELKSHAAGVVGDAMSDEETVQQQKAAQEDHMDELDALTEEDRDLSKPTADRG